MMVQIQRVQYVPKELKPGILYVAQEFDIAVHLCACGCGSKVTTPLGPTEWTVKETASGPSLYPSVGNWQLACQSHYWIDGGEIRWAKKWTPDQIARGRKLEEERRRSYYDALERKRGGLLRRLWYWAKSLFRS